MTPSPQEAQIIEAVESGKVEPFRGIPECPVTPLGHSDGLYFFCSAEGEVRELKWRDITKYEALLSLFGANDGWLIKHFPKLDKDGQIVAGAFNPRSAAKWLLAHCVFLGHFSLKDVFVRGLGVWKTPHGLACHCGDLVLYEGEWRRPGAWPERQRGDPLYTLHGRSARPAAQGAKAEDARLLRDTFGLWNFADPGGPDLLTGWTGAAFYGQAAPWRAHIVVNAPFGAGKSLLADVVLAAMGAGAHPSTNNFSAAGLQQALNNSALALVLDEAESESGRVAAVIELIRTMSGAGAHIVRGSAEGQARIYTINGSVYLSAIIPPELKPQDKSRILVLTLRPLTDLTGTPRAAADQLALRFSLNNQAAEVQRRMAMIARQAAGLRRRMLDRFTAFLTAFETYRGLIMERLRAAPREADQLGTILAGREIMLFDDAPSGDDLDEALALVRPFVKGHEEDAVDGEGAQCLLHLLGQHIDHWRQGDRHTVGQQIEVAFASPTERGLVQTYLTAIGLKLQGQSKDIRDGEIEGLLVANEHPGLRRIFEGTRWKGGGWRTALAYLKGAQPWPRTVRFIGPGQRALFIPSEHLPKGEYDQ